MGGGLKNKNAEVNTTPEKKPGEEKQRGREVLTEDNLERGKAPRGGRRKSWKFWGSGQKRSEDRGRNTRKKKRIPKQGGTKLGGARKSEDVQNKPTF